MIVGSGLISKVLSDTYGVIQYAAGVSNSRCTDPDEFQRDRDRLEKALAKPGLFVYFSTCSEEDTDYVRHKRQCEAMVRNRGSYLICRLPIVAGRTSNPHTLLNYLHSRISRSEKFDLWPDARRNIVDVADVGRVVRWLINQRVSNETINIAAPFDYSMREIVTCFERILEKPAVVKERPGGETKPIDVTRIKDAPVEWSGNLQSIIWKYYG